MDFSEALAAMKDGKRVRRAAWDETGFRSGAYAEVRDIPGYEPMIMVAYATGQARPFAGSQWDLLAGDWEVAG